MTKKERFINKGEDIFQYGEWWCSAKGEHCADVIATAMNELVEEKEQLKQENQELHKLNQEYINNLSDEKKETLSEMLNAILGDDVE